MAAAGELVLRQRICGNGDCRALFWICRHCDRGQRYCSADCRALARLRQRRCANRRHQQSPEGRLDHRDRQRHYRARRAQARVTDQGSLLIPASGMIPLWRQRSLPAAANRALSRAEPRSRGWLRCIVCGRAGRYVEAFAPVPRSGW